MYRYSKFTRILAALLALILMAGCTSPSQVVMTTAATTTPLVTTKAPAVTTKAPIATTTVPSATTAAPKSDPAPDFGSWTAPSGAVYPFASGKAVAQANYPTSYASVDMAYDSWEYPYPNDKAYEIRISLPFDETVANGEEPYLVKDAAVSEKIVTCIIEQAEFLAEQGLPKMRGQQKYAEMEIKSVHLYVYMQTVINNVVSFLIHRNIELAESSSTSLWLNDTTTLNFDLNTGDAVPLAALFADGCDYKARINEEIEAYLTRYAQLDESIYGNDYQLRLLAPFAGIRDDQPWYVVAETLFILLDFGNPEVHMTEAVHAIDIPLHRLSDCLALYDRYASEDVLTAQEPIYLLTTETGLDNGVGGVVDFGEPSKYRYTTVEYMAEGLTDAARKAFTERRMADQFPIQSFKVMADADLAQGEEGYLHGYEQTVYTSIVGGYAVMDFTAYLWGFEQRDLNRAIEADYCWNLKEDRPAVISDFFVEGYDYVAALTECLRELQYHAKILEHVDSIEAIIDTSVPSPAEPTRSDVLMLYPTSHGFSFRIPMSGTDKWGELYDEHYGCIGGYIEYSEFGYENLTMFQ